jgi:hypothetical protein
LVSAITLPSMVAMYSSGAFGYVLMRTDATLRATIDN